MRATHVYDTRNRARLRSFVRLCLAGKPIRVFIALQCVLSNHRPYNGAISFLRRRDVYLGARNEVAAIPVGVKIDHLAESDRLLD